MGRIRELIYNFLNPIEPEKSLDELVKEDTDLSESDKEALLNTANGVKNFKFAADVEETKKGKGKKISVELTKHSQNKSEQTPVVEQENVVIEDDGRDI